MWRDQYVLAFVVRLCRVVIHKRLPWGSPIGKRKCLKSNKWTNTSKAKLMHALTQTQVQWWTILAEVDHSGKIQVARGQRWHLSQALRHAYCLHLPKCKEREGTFSGRGNIWSKERAVLPTESHSFGQSIRWVRTGGGRPGAKLVSPLSIVERPWLAPGTCLNPCALGPVHQVTHRVWMVALLGPCMTARTSNMLDTSFSSFQGSFSLYLPPNPSRMKAVAGEDSISYWLKVGLRDI